MKRTIYAFCLTLFFMGRAFPRETIDLIDTQNTDTLLRGYYHIYSGFYENGGLAIKTSIGVADFINLGIIQDVRRTIGHESIIPSIPGVTGKVRILKYNPGWAIGYDLFHIGGFGREDKRPISGLYTALAIPVFISDSEKRLIFGLRMPMQPEIIVDDISPYIGFHFPITNEFELNFEMSNIFFTGDRISHIIWGGGVRVNIANVLGIELNLKYSAFENSIDRILSIDYTNVFM